MTYDDTTVGDSSSGITSPLSGRTPAHNFHFIRHQSFIAKKRPARIIAGAADDNACYATKKDHQHTTEAGQKHSVLLAERHRWPGTNKVTTTDTTVYKPREEGRSRNKEKNNKGGNAMYLYPVHISPGPYRGQNEQRKAAYLEQRNLALRIEDYINASMQHAAPGEPHLFGYAGISQALNVPREAVKELLSPLDNDWDGITVARPPHIATKQVLS